MKQFTFEYKENAVGVIVVYADNEEDAKEKALNHDGEVYISKSVEDVGELLVAKDVN